MFTLLRIGCYFDLCSYLELEVKEEASSDHEGGGDMQVIDDMDADHSDHDSHISGASSFSHTFSHSPSFSGSLSGSFSGSLSLSSFSGSNTSLGKNIFVWLKTPQFNPNKGPK